MENGTLERARELNKLNNREPTKIINPPKMWSPCWKDQGAKYCPTCDPDPKLSHDQSRCEKTGCEICAEIQRKPGTAIINE